MNGADGTVVSMLYARNVRLPNLPIAVIVQFPNYTGPSFLQNCSHSVPIVPFKTKWPGKNNSKKHFVREQLPLRIGYADTMHHVQGKTLARCAIDLSPKEMAPSISFVALSRVRKLEYVMIARTFYKRFENLKASKQLKVRLAEEKRLVSLDLCRSIGSSMQP